jgi:hypothetical protein
MIRIASLLLLLLLMTGCSHYTIGAANAAPRVVSGETGIRSDHLSEHTGEEHTEEMATLPELDSARLVVQEAFAVVRGSKAAREEAATSLETTRETLHTLH